MIDSNRWLDTLPNKKINFDQEYHRINSEKLINTFPKKDTNSVMKKYSVLTILFVAGLILVSIIKNETRELQREINNLKASIRILSLDLHQETLDHEVITSPENISNLAKEYLEYDLNYYKISQIGELNKSSKIFTSIAKTDDKNNISEKSKKLKSKIKLQVAKKIEEKKEELKKLKGIYQEPEKLPGEIKSRVAKRIEKTKSDIKKLYTDPTGSISTTKVQRWAAVQVVKAFFGIPIIPGK